MFDVSGLTEVKMQKRNGWQGSYYVDKHDICQAKTCARCKEIVRAEFFGPDKHRKYGLKMYCRDCSPSVAGTHRTRSDEQIKIDRDRVRPHGTKKCHICTKYKAFDMFTVSRAKLDGLADRCKTCDKSIPKSTKKYTYAYNSEYRKKYAKKYKARLSARSDEHIKRDMMECHPEGVKLCRECTNLISLDNFYIKRSVKDGLRDECKPCSIKKSNERRVRPYVLYWEAHNIPLECYVCGDPWDDADHVVPKHSKGSDEPYNRLPICEPCNSSKWKHPLLEWLSVKHPSIADDVLYRVGVKYGMDY